MQPRFTVWNLAQTPWKSLNLEFPYWETNHSPFRGDKTNKRLSWAALKNHRTRRRGGISCYELPITVDAEQIVTDDAVAVFLSRKVNKLAKLSVLFNTAAYLSSSHEVIGIKWRPLHQYKGWSCRLLTKLAAKNLIGTCWTWKKEGSSNHLASFFQNSSTSTQTFSTGSLSDGCVK